MVRGPRRYALALALALAGTFLSPLTANAWFHPIWATNGTSNCSPTNTVGSVIRADMPNSSWRTNATGAIGSFPIINRPYNSLCLSESDVFGSGIAVLFVNKSGATQKYVEVGYDGTVISSSASVGNYPTSEGWDAYGSGHAWDTKLCYSASCFLDLGVTNPATDRCNYRINLVDGTTDWKAWARCGSNPTYTLLYTFSNTGFTHGIPMSVTWRRGGTATGMLDNVSNLQYRDGVGNFNPWVNNGSYPPFAGTTVSDWTASAITATSYSVVHT